MIAKNTAADLAPAAGEPLLPLRRAGWTAWAPHVFVALYAICFCGLIWHTLIEDFGVPNQVAACLGFAQALALPLALYWPLSGWWLSLAAGVAAAVAAAAAPGWAVARETVALWPGPDLAAHLSVLALVGMRVRLRAQVEMWALTLVAGIALAVAFPDRDPFTGVLSMSVYSAVVLVAVGALRSRGEAMRRLAEQRGISERERARRALLEERARIARELHDVVAHHMSVIAIQAEAAPLRVPDPPGELTRSFATIRGNAVEALTELHRVLDVLRGDHGPPVPEEEDAPQPTLDRLDDLLSGVRGAGLSVAVEVAGTRRPLAQGVELSAYRIVQEALSNVLRHAQGAEVTVTLDYSPDRLDVHVTNTAGTGAGASGRAAASGGGHGLVGMRERAAMLGGTLTAGARPGGGYAVLARLPTAPSGRPPAELPVVEPVTPQREGPR
ncbi:sensor histidine kinase [Actinomadura vinacea]|uniref:sensor histidine kinase n=1 Tax=Actinomadura vinacea TaxID=115336 RepID=UPI0031E4470D